MKKASRIGFAFFFMMVGEAIGAWWWPPSNIEITPQHSTSCDVVAITLGGEWPNSCTPNGSAVSVIGKDIYFDVIVDYPPGTFCLTVITPWGRTESVGPLSPGRYTIYARLIGDPMVPEMYTWMTEFVVTTPIYGVCHGPFRKGQTPGETYPTEAQIKEDISIISEIASAERTYGIDNVLFQIPELCDLYGVDCYVGGWISDSDSWNQQTTVDLIDIASQNYDTTKALIVGNEFLQWRPFSAESKLISLINKVSDATEIPVTTAETYETWLNHPNLVNVVDFIGVHIHPYWDGIHVNDAAQHVIDKYNLIKQAYPTEEVVILETGWPTEGDVHGDAVPSEANQEKFLGDFIPLAEENNIKYFIFEAFDEPWKGSGVESHWGIYYEDRTLKPRLESILYPNAIGIIGDFCGANSDQPDGYVDYWDLLYFARCWHCRRGDPCWDDPFLKCSKCDLSGPNGDPDGYIDYWDLLVFAQQWHTGQKP